MKNGIKKGEVFGKEYSKVYDIIYEDKDYEKECALLEKIFKEFGLSPKNILDLGCGSGGHAIPLAIRGYKFTGVDISESMLEKARKKSRRLGLNINFLKGDIRSVRLKEKYDVVISMFAVVSYQIDNKSVLSTFKTAYSHLKNRGLFIFDVWFRPAVLIQKPSERIKEIIDKKTGERIIRIAKPEIDIINHTVSVNYKILKIKERESGEKIVLEEFEEKHTLRYFFPKEIELIGQIILFYYFFILLLIPSHSFFLSFLFLSFPPLFILIYRKRTCDK